MGFDRLINLRYDASTCVHCGHCKVVPLPVVRDGDFMDQCPSSMHFHNHAYSGGGRSIMALSLIDGRIQPDKAMADIVFACDACGYCDTACKFIMDSERQQVNMAMREHMVEKGLAPQVHTDTVKSLKRYEAFPAERPRLPAWANGLNLRLVPEEDAEVLLYVGCAEAAESDKSTARKLAKLLLSAGVNLGVLGTAEPCCGYPAYSRGYRDDFTRIANTNIDLFGELNEVGINTIVTLSGTCLGTFRSKYPEYVHPFSTQVLHATEMLDSLVKSKKLRLSKPVKGKVTYHDPCFLGRQSEPPTNYHGVRKVSLKQLRSWDPPKPVNRGANGVYDAPRELLKAIPGLEFVEMYRIREYALCCGAGGGAADVAAEMAYGAGKNRIEEARKVGADLIVSACQKCESHLMKSQQSSGGATQAMRIADIIDLVFSASGLEN
jgi:Fe-S oxidoreductase